MNTASVEVRDVWKVFGARAEEAMFAIKSRGLTKKEVQEEFGCVVGVQGASFEVAKGEIFCVMGLSGSGKSTLIRHINLLLRPTVGSVLIDGQDVTSIGEKDLRMMRADKIGMVFQNIALLPHQTVLNNVALPLDVKGMSRKERREIAEKALAMVDLSGWEFHYAHELSGGMQQRVGLARALAADPDILLMDEPFSALDPLIRRQLQDEFLRLAEITGKTTIFITHDLDEAIRIGHRIAIMKDGVLVQIGTPEEIVSKPADEYVEKFVAGISRLKLVSARSIMVPIKEFCTTQDAPPTDAPRAPEDADLDHLIDIAVDYDGPVVVTNPEGHEVGVVDRQHLLRGIQGGELAS